MLETRSILYLKPGFQFFPIFIISEIGDRPSTESMSLNYESDFDIPRIREQGSPIFHDKTSKKSQTQTESISTS